MKLPIRPARVGPEFQHLHLGFTARPLAFSRLSRFAREPLTNRRLITKSKHETNVRRNSTAALVLAVLFALMIRVEGAERQKLHGHVPEAVARLRPQPVGRVPGTNQLHLAISSLLHNTNAMAQRQRGHQRGQTIT
jgi:hypothetical protein